MKKLILTIVIFFTILSIHNIVKGQQNIRDNFLVDKISRYENSNNYAVAEYIYDINNKLQKRIITGKFEENFLVRDLKYVDLFVYEDNRVSRIYTYDSTHFISNNEVHFFYDTQNKLIRSERWFNNIMSGGINYHYENGDVVHFLYDNNSIMDTLLYDSLGNLTTIIKTYPMHDVFGDVIPGELETRRNNYIYDSNLKPNFGVDYLFAYQFIPWLGTSWPSEVMNLSNNNLIKAMSEMNTYNYTYNQYGLPITMQYIFDPVGPVIGQFLTITYKQIGEIGISAIVNDNIIKLYPNPAENTLNIESRDIIKEIEFYDALGKKTKTITLNRKETIIDISSLAKGNYIVNLITDKGKITKKLVVR
ncbi:MAG: T9SS type A sorting domain-containing protein [Bacteroidales bacterium]|nr:T9SS type A sorting domain-containing protein [Bacteroidales bacterium]